jgi:hypothetical protein
VKCLLIAGFLPTQRANCEQNRRVPQIAREGIDPLAPAGVRGRVEHRAGARLPLYADRSGQQRVVASVEGCQAADDREADGVSPQSFHERGR